MELHISTGKSRFETKWKNTTITWQKLLNRLQQPTRTPETYAEYRKMSKPQQDKAKDVGGFVGGQLKGGHRRSGNVISRSLITLDLDFAPYDFFDTVKMLANYTCCVYSTHKHSADTPRYRLIIPLDRDVSPDEYEAIARRIASDIGIEFFDDTTYQPSRLMYWPSCSSDGEFVFDYLDGSFLNSDSVLRTYSDWKDASLWPESSRTVRARNKLSDKQGDPHEKPGLIGAFCRTYDIPDAIEKFLPDVYVECASPGRYTYTGGSTSAGLVLYDDNKFAYSNHGTDPASGKLCNAFDLVRLHLYGEKDENCELDGDVTKLPSYSAMLELARNDDDTKRNAIQERVSSARTEFSEGEETDWELKLEVNKKGEILPTIDNILLILNNDPRLKGLSGYNEFDFKLTILGETPWRKSSIGDAWTDADDAGLMHYLESSYGIYNGKKTAEALEIAQQAFKFHPVRNYLDSLPKWDGVGRIDTLFVDYLGAEDCEYTRAVTRKMLVAAVARIYRPGLKYDNMLTLVGPQGVGKSYILKLLGVSWFSDSLTTVQGKEAYESLHGNWIIEMAELTAAKKSEVEAVKHFISKQEDGYRMAYAKRVGVFPRQCVFFGTTNDEEFLRDRTGNRRFWPVKVGGLVSKDLFSELEPELPQVWAEAKQKFADDEPLYLDTRLNDMAIEQQAEHTERDSRQGAVEYFLDMKIPKNWAQMGAYEKREYIEDYDESKVPEGSEQRDRICTMEVWVELFNKDEASLDKVKAREINAMLDVAPGWKKSERAIKFRSPYGTQRGYKRG